MNSTHSMEASTYVHQPGPRKPKLCIWSDLNVYNMDQILIQGNTSETKTFLKKLFELDETAKHQILLDLYMQTIVFAKRQKFSKEQASAFFSILKQTHEMCVSTPFGNVEACFLFFRELVLTHSVHRPPWSLEIFTSAQVETITTHVIDTYFRHFKMYKYAFTPKVKLDISFHYEGIPPTPQPSAELEGEQLEEQLDEDSKDAVTISVPVSEEVLAEQPVESAALAESLVPDGEAIGELENVVRKAVTAQLKQMHATIERQLEDTDKSINDKIQALESGKLQLTPKSAKGRSPKGSAKGKKK